MSIGFDNMEVTNDDLSEKWVLMDGHENLMRIGEVKLANEKSQDKNSSNEFCVRQVEKWSRNLLRVEIYFWLEIDVKSMGVYYVFVIFFIWLYWVFSQTGPSLELSCRLEAGGCAVRASPVRLGSLAQPQRRGTSP